MSRRAIWCEFVSQVISEIHTYLCMAEMQARRKVKKIGGSLKRSFKEEDVAFIVVKNGEGVLVFCYQNCSDIL